MPLFICAKCGCVENTALSTYWFRKNLTYADGLEKYQDKPLCSECGTADGDRMVHGKWHEQFPREKATERQKRNVGTDGLIGL